MKKMIYYFLFVSVVIFAGLTTVSAISNIQFVDIYPNNQLTSSPTSGHYQVRSINFDYKTEAIAAFKSNGNDQFVEV
ncbi:MAG TPA: hypothetical protein GXZ58_00480 [Bacilli bacterium]|nr:hypothetical protein [Bacilli bacterium]